MASVYLDMEWVLVPDMWIDDADIEDRWRG